MTAAPGGEHLILRWIGSRCVEHLHADGAAVCVSGSDHSWGPVYATDDTARELCQYSFTVGEGPCPDALATLESVLVDDVAAQAADRWPIWAPRAVQSGVRSVAAFPIRAGAVATGVLMVHFAGPRQLTPDEIGQARRLADAAFLGLLDLRAGLRQPGTVDHYLSTAIQADVHRAAGMVMVQAGVSLDAALALLRARAFSENRSITVVATEVLERRLRFDREQDGNPDDPTAGKGTTHDD